MKKYDRYMQNLCDAYVQQFPLSEKYSPYMIWKMAKSQDSTVRGYLAKALVYDTGSVCAVDVLCKLAKDKDSLVRVEAIDSLSEFCCEKSYHVFENAVNDPDVLVRKYATFGLAWLGRSLCPQSTEELLLALEKRENNSHVLIGIYEGLYVLGHEEYFGKLIDLFKINDYQVQCSVLNVFSEIINEKNKAEMKAFVDKVEREQYPKSVQFSLDNLEAVLL